MLLINTFGYTCIKACNCSKKGCCKHCAALSRHHSTLILGAHLADRGCLPFHAYHSCLLAVCISYIYLAQFQIKAWCEETHLLMSISVAVSAAGLPVLRSLQPPLPHHLASAPKPS